MKELTARQQKVFEFIRDFIRKNNRSPSIREIGEAFEISSTFGVDRHLVALEKKGYIERDARIARGIKLPDRFREIDGIPLVGRVAAGVPITAIENIEGYCSLGSIFGNPQMLFLLKVKGDSMIGAGINDGDLVVVWKQPRVENGEIGVAIVNGEATVKRIYREKNVVRLEPDNLNYKPVSVNVSKSEFSIAGKVIGAIRRFTK